MGGAAGADAACDQPVSLLLQPAGDSGTAADSADVGGVESGGAAWQIAAAGCSVDCDRVFVHADDADQDDCDFSAAGGGLGDAGFALGRGEARDFFGAVFCCGGGDVCAGVWPVDGAGNAHGAAAGLQIPVLR